MNTHIAEGDRREKYRGIGGSRGRMQAGAEGLHLHAAAAAAVRRCAMPSLGSSQ
jgi:hypothetical protein